MAWLQENWTWFSFTAAWVIGIGIGMWFSFEHDRRENAERPSAKDALTPYQMQQATIEIWLVMHICQFVIFCGIKREKLVRALREQALTDDVLRENFVLRHVADKLERPHG